MIDRHAHDQLKHLLLDMLSTSRAVDAEQTATLSEGDWDIICDMARQHRLGPLLHHHRQTIGSHWSIPASVRQRWAAAYRQSALRSMRVRQTLQRLDDILREASIAYAALKGAWLIQKAYPHPALRPMRDVDIIVSPGAALAVFDLLKSRGFLRPYAYAQPTKSTVESDKHLPPLRDTKTGISVEVHSRLIDHIPAGEMQGNIADTNALLARSVRENGMDFLTPTDTLLHLVVHAVYDHQFNNGPLSLNDIALLAASTEIEWDRFWQMAQTGNWTRGCELLFAMVRHYHDFEFPERKAAAIGFTAVQLESAKLLTLQEFEDRGTVAFRARFMNTRTLAKRIALLWNRAFPTRSALANFSGSDNATAWVFVHYPKWIIVRAGQMLFKQQTRSVSADIERAAILENTLGCSRL